MVLCSFTFGTAIPSLLSISFKKNDFLFPKFTIQLWEQIIQCVAHLRVNYKLWMKRALSCLRHTSLHSVLAYGLDSNQYLTNIKFHTKTDSSSAVIIRYRSYDQVMITTGKATSSETNCRCTWWGWGGREGGREGKIGRAHDGTPVTATGRNRCRD